MRSSTLFFLLTGTTLAFTSAINVYLGYSAWASQAFYSVSPVTRVLLHDIMIVERGLGYAESDRELYRTSLRENLYNAMQTSVAKNEVGMAPGVTAVVETAEVMPTTEIKSTTIQTQAITIPTTSTSQSTASNRSTPPISIPPVITAVTTTIPDATPTPLLFNGDFESSSISPWTTIHTGTGVNFSLTGSTTHFPTYDGSNQGLFHQTNGTGSSSISQRINVIPGKTYSFTAYSYYHHPKNSCTLVALIDDVALGNLAVHSVWTLDEYFFTPVKESVVVSVEVTCANQGIQVMAVDEIEIVEVEMEDDEVEEHQEYVPPVLSASYTSTTLFPSSTPSAVAFPTITDGASCISAVPYGRYSISTTRGSVSRYRV